MCAHFARYLLPLVRLMKRCLMVCYEKRKYLHNSMRMLNILFWQFILMVVTVHTQTTLKWLLQQIKTHFTFDRYTYRTRLDEPEFSALPRDPSRSTLCRSGSLNGLRWFRLLFRVASNGRYICGMYGANPPVNPELLGFINESHSCFIVFNGNGDVADALFLWCLRSCSCDCDCAAAKRPCSVDKPLTCTRGKQTKKNKVLKQWSHWHSNCFLLFGVCVNFFLMQYLKVFSCF